jgi:hypothetical protein
MWPRELVDLRQKTPFPQIAKCSVGREDLSQSRQVASMSRPLNRQKTIQAKYYLIFL